MLYLHFRDGHAYVNADLRFAIFNSAELSLCLSPIIQSPLNAQIVRDWIQIQTSSLGAGAGMKFRRDLSGVDAE